jgi:hypothetical protein
MGGVQRHWLHDYTVGQEGVLFLPHLSLSLVFLGLQLPSSCPSKNRQSNESVYVEYTIFGCSSSMFSQALIGAS